VVVYKVCRTSSSNTTNVQLWCHGLSSDKTTKSSQTRRFIFAVWCHSSLQLRLIVL